MATTTVNPALNMEPQTLQSNTFQNIIKLVLRELPVLSVLIEVLLAIRLTCCKDVAEVHTLRAP
jgi:hypothetical protein